MEKESYKLRPRNWGAAVMEKLVRGSDGIKLVVCGHSGDPSRMAAMGRIQKREGRENSDSHV